MKCFFVFFSPHISIAGPEEAGPDHRVLLLQHPEAGDQPPAEVRASLLSVLFPI